MALDKKNMSIYGSKVNFEDSSMKALLNSAGIYSRRDIDLYSKFARNGVIDPFNNSTSTKEFVFFTRPDLHIFENKNRNKLNDELKNIPLFTDAMKRYRPLLRQMQLSATSEGPFINLLSNMITSSIDLPGINAEQTETAANIYGTVMSYRQESNKSDENHDFSIEFMDTKFLEVYMFFKLFDEYERRKYFGEITPPDTNYRFRKILHDQIAIYKFIVGEDGETLLYWAKLYGCFPKSVPREAFSDMSANSGIKFTTSWRAIFVEDMDPQILADFNLLVKPYLSKYKTVHQLYNTTIDAPDGKWSGIPFIAIPNTKFSNYTPSEMEYKYLLKWRL